MLLRQDRYRVGYQDAIEGRHAGWREDPDYMDGYRDGTAAMDTPAARRKQTKR